MRADRSQAESHTDHVSDSDETQDNLDIAVIAMEGRFPGARDVAEFWNNLVAGREAVEPISDEAYLTAGGNSQLLDHPDLVMMESAVEGIELFDAAFFGYGKTEAKLIDPQQRHFLECAYHTLERAGYLTYDGDIGVYAGCGQAKYYQNSILPRLAGRPDPTDQLVASISNSAGAFATRVSYELDLTGPSMSVQTACSTSLVAVHMACQALIGYHCDMALAGGATLNPTPKRGYRYIPEGPFSPDGHCRPFDVTAAGTVPGDGVGVVLLKRLADALADRDRILAVIKGTAINNDGRRKIGFTAPSPLGQTDVIVAAHAAAGVSADSIDYVEAHGTATPVGDPIEVQALTRAFRRTTENIGFCALGSVKSNIGHTDTAAGIAGLIKTVLALRHATIPASLNFTDPNPLIDFANSPFFVNRACSLWPARSGPRRAGVSSFGIGGTNAHVVLQEPPTPPRTEPPDPYSILTMSARTPTAVCHAAVDMADHLTADLDQNISDVAYTLQVGRTPMPYRHAVVGADAGEAAGLLRAAARTTPPRADERAVVFMFPGVGAQHDGMGRGLYAAVPMFRAQIDRCAEIVRAMTGRDLRTILYDEGAHAVYGDHTHHLDESAAEGSPMVSAALLATEYALARWLISVGIRPAAMIGHSMGEYTAACLAGVFRLEDALCLVIERERLFHSVGGATYSVALGEHELAGYLSEGLALATVNGPSNCSVSGSAEDLAELAARLTAADVKWHQLRIPVAAHSALLEPVLESYAETMRTVRFGEPEIPFVSNVTGAWITAEGTADPDYWVRQLRRTVRFADGIDQVTEHDGQSPPVLLEVGPDGGLCKLAIRQLGPSALTVPAMPHAYADQSDERVLLGALARLWEHGVPVDWTALHVDRHRQRVPLPGYRFERTRLWVAPPDASDLAAAWSAEGSDAFAPEIQETPGPEHAFGGPADPPSAAMPRPPMPVPYVSPRTDLERQLASRWEQALGIEGIGVHDNFFDLGGESLVILQLVATVRAATGVSLSPRQLFISHRLTIAGFAEEIEERQAEETSSSGSEDQYDRYAASTHRRFEEQ